MLVKHQKERLSLRSTDGCFAGPTENTSMKLYLPLGAAAGLLALSGCAGPNDYSPPPPAVVYANQPPPPPAGDNGGALPAETTYVPPGTYATAPTYSQDDYEDNGAPVPQEGEVEVQTVADFDEPLQPYGEWVVVGSYGRCWRPRHVEGDWRPYCDGHWVETDQGWYWQSDEPWGWATYHYGRWDFDASYGWVWVPHTRWAPAWVAWRSGGGYIGWAPWPPGARFDHGHDMRNPQAPDRNFVFVHENHFDQRVRPSTVVVNNTTIIHQTTNITNITIVNNRVQDGGPRPEVVAKATGHDFHPQQAVQLRRQIEKPVATQHPVLAHPHANPPTNHGNNTTTPNQTNGARGPIGDPAHNSQPYGVSPQNQNHTATHPQNETHTVQPNNAPRPTVIPHPTARPSTPPAHLNQELHHEINPRPTMKPLQPDKKLNDFHATPTMKPLENRVPVTVTHPTHAPTVPPRPQTVDPRTTTREPHDLAPQQRPKLPANQTPVLVPHNNAEPVGPGRGGVGQQGGANTIHPPEHTVVNPHTPPPQQPKPKIVTPPPPPPKQKDDSQNQPQPQK